MTAYSPKSCIDIPEHMHSLAIAYFAASKTVTGERSFYCGENSVAVLAHGTTTTRTVTSNFPLVVSVELFNLHNDEFVTPEVDIGMQFGGGLDAGTMLYSGVNKEMRPVPALSPTTVEIPNSYYQARKKNAVRSESDSSAVDLSGDMSAWMVDDGAGEDSMDAPTGARVTCAMFPTDKKKVVLNPSVNGGFEEIVSDSHLVRTNGVSMPSEWKNLRQTLSY